MKYIENDRLTWYNLIAQKPNQGGGHHLPTRNTAGHQPVCIAAQSEVLRRAVFKSRYIGISRRDSFDGQERFPERGYALRVHRDEVRGLLTNNRFS